MVVNVVSSLGASILMVFDANARFNESQEKGCINSLRASINKNPPLA